MDPPRFIVPFADPVPKSLNEASLPRQAPSLLLLMLLPPTPSSHSISLLPFINLLLLPSFDSLLLPSPTPFYCCPPTPFLRLPHTPSSHSIPLLPSQSLSLLPFHSLSYIPIDNYFIPINITYYQYLST